MSNLFPIFSMFSYVHSDWSFCTFKELENFPQNNGTAYSRKTAYNLQSTGQVGRPNGTLWRICFGNLVEKHTSQVIRYCSSIGSLLHLVAAVHVYKAEYLTIGCFMQ